MASAEPVTELRSCTIPFSCWLMVNDAIVPLYGLPPSGDAGPLSCWAESIPGANFAIGYNLEMAHAEQDYQVQVSMDGFVIQRFNHSRQKSDPQRETLVDRTNITGVGDCKLIFDRIDFAEPTAAEVAPPSQTLGSAKLELWWGEKGSGYLATPQSFAKEGFTGTVDERKIKKGLSERAGLGKKMATEEFVRCSTFTRASEEPAVVFEIKYANKIILEKLGHIKPDSNSPLHLARPLLIDSDDDELEITPVGLSQPGTSRPAKRARSATAIGDDSRESLRARLDALEAENQRLRASPQDEKPVKLEEDLQPIELAQLKEQYKDDDELEFIG